MAARISSLTFADEVLLDFDIKFLRNSIAACNSVHHLIWTCLPHACCGPPGVFSNLTQRRAWLGVNHQCGLRVIAHQLQVATPWHPPDTLYQLSVITGYGSPAITCDLTGLQVMVLWGPLLTLLTFPDLISLYAFLHYYYSHFYYKLNLSSYILIEKVVMKQ